MGNKHKFTWNSKRQRFWKKIKWLPYISNITKLQNIPSFCNYDKSRSVRSCLIFLEYQKLKIQALRAHLSSSGEGVVASFYHTFHSVKNFNLIGKEMVELEFDHKLPQIYHTYHTKLVINWWRNCCFKSYVKFVWSTEHGQVAIVWSLPTSADRTRDPCLLK